MLATDAKTKKIKPDPIFLYIWWTNVSEAVCKCDWHNVRSYLFFNVQIFQTRYTPQSSASRRTQTHNPPSRFASLSRNIKTLLEENKHSLLSFLSSCWKRTRGRENKAKSAVLRTGGTLFFSSFFSQIATFTRRSIRCSAPQWTELYFPLS